MTPSWISMSMSTFLKSQKAIILITVIIIIIINNNNNNNNIYCHPKRNNFLVSMELWWHSWFIIISLLFVCYVQVKAFNIIQQNRSDVRHTSLIYLHTIIITSLAPWWWILHLRLFYNMRCFVMFVTAVCVLFLLK